MKFKCGYMPKGTGKTYQSVDFMLKYGLNFCIYHTDGSRLTIVKKKYTLFLDDCRSSYGISVDVINFEQFKKTIEEKGLPDAVSFDHDLGENEPDGTTCARWLCNYCLVNKLTLPKWSIHSGNPVGAANIRSILESFEKIQSEN